MAQMTIYLDADTQKAVEAAAAREDVSLSRWARKHLQEAAFRSSQKHSLDSFYGAIADESFEAPAEVVGASDVTRPAFD